MIIKKRRKPLPLEKLDAAIPRLSPQFHDWQNIKSDAAIMQKGYTGELKVDYHLEYLANQYTILQDVYLKVNGKNFQIDSAIIAEHAIYLVDAKNYSGTITFDTILKQLTRSDGKMESGYEYPITQVENQRFHLQNLLSQQHLTNIPIFCLIAISEPSTVIKVIGDTESLSKIVAHGARVPSMILEKEQQLKQEGYRKLSHRKIGNHILNLCGTFDKNSIKQYNIKPTDLMPGVFCPECGKLGMERIYGSWHCDKCDNYSKTAHLSALSDYLLLVKTLYDE
ncbi:nuclease-related domain-containing protein [Virgibacillus kekensis]|uniref:Nuclease-related domain-containing protein n=1 Tax=Virgibacillus kekensis TaxID=202261 RepID=A0ABV9DGI5_9BACI